MRRSVSLLGLLLASNAIDLELASAVVGLDPGLTFDVLQLANRQPSPEDDRTWEIPLALVSAGRQELLRLIEYVPVIERTQTGDGKALPAVVSDAVTRASIAYLLARELGGTNPRKAFLAGLLFDLAALAQTALPASRLRGLRPAWLRLLPVDISGAALDTVDGGPKDRADLLRATVALSQKVAEAVEGGAPASLQELAQSPLWQSWIEISHTQRALLLAAGCKAGAWARANLQRLEPWDFMAKLEGRRLWEQICKAYAL